MIRRKLTLKRVDPWSVLKFGFVVNLALLLVLLLGAWILWIVIGRLGLVDQFCGSVGEIVLDLQECSLNGGNLFQTLLFLGLLGVVVQTGILVFGAFLYNLISDLTGGLTFTFLDESDEAAAAAARPASRTAANGGQPSSARPTATPTPRSSTSSTGQRGSTAGTSSAPGGPASPSPAPSTRPSPSSTGPQPTQAPTRSTGTPATPAEPSRQAPERSRTRPDGSLWGDPTTRRD